MNDNMRKKIKESVDRLRPLHHSKYIKNMFKIALSDEIIDPIVYSNEQSLKDTINDVFKTRQIFSNIFYIYEDNYIVLFDTYHGKYAYIYDDNENKLIELKDVNDGKHFCIHFDLQDGFSMLILTRNHNIMPYAFITYGNLIINRLSFKQFPNYQLQYKPFDDNADMFFKLDSATRQKLMDGINGTLLLLQIGGYEVNYL